MKFLLDFLPLILFFATYKVGGMHADASAAFATHWLGGIVSGGVVGAKEAPVLLATVVVIVATLLQVGVMRLQRRRIDLMLWISLAMIVFFGGLTVWFHNDTFIKWKPSIVCWAMGLILWLSQAMFRRNLLRQTLGAEIELTDKVWQRLNFAWVAYFAAMGFINLWVAYSFSTDVWASFHAFGSTVLSALFFAGQFFYLMRHIEQPAAADKPAP